MQLEDPRILHKLWIITYLSISLLLRYLLECVCVCHVCGYPQRLEEGVRLPGAGSCEPRDLGAGAELGSSGRAVGALAHWAISTVPHLPIIYRMDFSIVRLCLLIGKVDHEILCGKNSFWTAATRPYYALKKRGGSNYILFSYKSSLKYSSWGTNAQTRIIPILSSSVSAFKVNFQCEKPENIPVVSEDHLMTFWTLLLSIWLCELVGVTKIS